MDDQSIDYRYARITKWLDPEERNPDSLYGDRISNRMWAARNAERLRRRGINAKVFESDNWVCVIRLKTSEWRGPTEEEIVEPPEHV